MSEMWLYQRMPRITEYVTTWEVFKHRNYKEIIAYNQKVQNFGTCNRKGRLREFNTHWVNQKLEKQRKTTSKWI